MRALHSVSILDFMTACTQKQCWQSGIYIKTFNQLFFARKTTLTNDMEFLPHLTIDQRGVVVLEEVVQKLLKGVTVRIIRYKHSLGVAGGAGADHLVGRVRHVALGVSDNSLHERTNGVLI